MAMEQLQLTKQTHSAAWIKIFTQDVTTLKGSLIFLKQFTALAFSIISYMRSIFPEVAYTEKEFDDVKVKILAGNYECKDAYLMTKWIKSAFDALDNSYMRELVLEILSPEDSPLEYYAIGYKYTAEGPTCSLSVNTKILDFDLLEFENSTKKLINNLLTITENLEPLPKKYKLQLRINYYDEATPRHYKPKFFSHAKGNDLEQLEKMTKKSMGSLETPYHSINIYSGSALVALNDSQQSFYLESDKEIPEKQSPDKILEKEIPGKIYLTDDTDKTSEREPDKISETTESTGMDADNDKETDDLKDNSNWTWTMDKSASQDVDSTIIMSGRSTNSEEKLCCICSLEYDKDSTFKCEHCDSLHHLVCYRISIFGKIPQKACCYACAKLDKNIECTDLTLMKYKPRQAKHLAVYRQVLYRCHGMKNISPKTLQTMNIPADLINQIMTKLLEENFIKYQNRARNIYKVCKIKLAHFHKHYFIN